MRLPGTTPAAPDDTGEADPRLTAALDGGDVREVAAVLLQVRVLLPVVAVASEHGEADMAVPALVGTDGARALPVFSSVATLRAWRGSARPVPMSGERVVAGAAGEGYAAIVVDVAGPAPCTLLIRRDGTTAGC